MPLKGDSHNNSLLEVEAFSVFVGERLGSGMSREVSACRLNPDLVVKIEMEAQRFQNITEWQTWEQVSHTECAQWFSPCVLISSAGAVLIQKKTTPILYENLPEMIPIFFSDLKQSNWGLFEGRAVCHDYGYSLALKRGLSTRLKRAVWLPD